MAVFRTQFAEQMGVFDPMSMLSKPYHQDIETQLCGEYARATEPVSAKDKDAADVTGEVKRDEDRVVLTLSTRELQDQERVRHDQGRQPGVVRPGRPEAVGVDPGQVRAARRGVGACDL